MDHQIDGSNLVPKKTAKERFRQAILRRWDAACAYCGDELGKCATLDHVVPRIKGGLTHPRNLVACCLDCNSRKGASDWSEWYRNQAFWCAYREGEIHEWMTEEEGEAG